MHARGPRRPGGTPRSVASRAQDPGVPRREPRGPAARGWCKTPSGRGLPGAWEAQDGPRTLSGRPGPGSRIPETGVPETLGPGVPRPQGWGGPFPDPGVPEGPGPRPGVPALGGFTSTPRAGAPRFPVGGTRGPGVPEVRKGPPGGPWATPAPGGLQTPPPGTAGPRREGLM